MTETEVSAPVDWWEDRAHRKSVTESSQKILEFLIEALQPEHLAAAMQAPTADYVSYWFLHGMTLEEETRLRLIYRAVKTAYYYAGRTEGHHYLHHPDRQWIPIRTLLKQEKDGRQLLQKLREQLAGRKPPPSQPRSGRNR